MSQNKTVFPGVSPEGTINPNKKGNENQPYSRTSSKSNGTIYPGMEMPSSDSNQHPKQNQNGGKPVAGFLYSVSRTAMGEYWPIHIGQNIIGTDPECDIVLAEGTVSSRHANLHINRMKKPEKTEATIVDMGSTNGTEVNTNSVSVARPIECVNGDIITVGASYELLLVLIDVKSLGLKPSDSFIDICEDQEEFDQPEDFSFSYTTSKKTHDGKNYPPRFYGPETDHIDNQGGQTDGTVGLDSNQGFRKGRTVGDY